MTTGRINQVAIFPLTNQKQRHNQPLEIYNKKAFLLRAFDMPSCCCTLRKTIASYSNQIKLWESKSGIFLTHSFKQRVNVSLDGSNLTKVSSTHNRTTTETDTVGNQSSTALFHSFSIMIHDLAPLLTYTYSLEIGTSRITGLQSWSESVRTAQQSTNKPVVVRNRDFHSTGTTVALTQRLWINIIRKK